MNVSKLTNHYLTLQFIILLISYFQIGKYSKQLTKNFLKSSVCHITKFGGYFQNKDSEYL